MLTFEEIEAALPRFHRIGKRVLLGTELWARCQSQEIAETVVAALIALDTLYQCPVCKILVGADAMPHHVTLHVTESEATS